MKKVWIHGVSGKMGQEIARLLEKDTRFQFAGGSHRGTDLSQLLLADAVIDVSGNEGLEHLVRFLETNASNQNFPKAFLICSTGYTQETVKKVNSIGQQRSNTKFEFSSNTSLGVAALHKALQAVTEELTSAGFDPVIDETHHRRKKDSPSGTALALAKTLRESAKEELLFPVHSTRAGGVFGEHRIRFVSEHEEVTFSHRAFSRTVFAAGALKILSKLL